MLVCHGVGRNDPDDIIFGQMVFDLDFVDLIIEKIQKGGAKMDLEEYLKRPESRTFTREEVESLLGERGYHCDPIDTLVKPGKSTWKESGYKQAVAQQEIYNMNKRKIPYHFAYIKFYITKEGYGPFALVAGKTNLGGPDFYFDLSKTKKDERPLEEILADKRKRGDKAKQFLLHTDGHWYTQEVLVVWQDGQALDKIETENQRFGRQARWAETVEADIGGLFGLFKS